MSWARAATGLPRGPNSTSRAGFSASGRRRRSRSEPRHARPARRSPCGRRWRCGRRGRSPCRGRRGAPGPPGSSRDAAPCPGRPPRPGARPRRAPGARGPRRASCSGLALAGVLGGDLLGGLGLGGRALRGLRGGNLGRGLLGLLGLLGGGLLGHGGALGLARGLLERLVEDLELVALGLRGLQRALGARQALELLPVTGDLEDGLDGLGRLRADAEPVLRPVGGDVDVRRVLLGVVLPDLLEDATVALLARVDDDDAVLRHPDLAEALQTDLDRHVGGVSLDVLCVVRTATPEWGHRVWILWALRRPDERVRARRTQREILPARMTYGRVRRRRGRAARPGRASGAPRGPRGGCGPGRRSPRGRPRRGWRSSRATPGPATRRPRGRPRGRTRTPPAPAPRRRSRRAAALPRRRCPHRSRPRPRRPT